MKEFPVPRLLISTRALRNELVQINSNTGVEVFRTRNKFAPNIWKYYADFLKNSDLTREFGNLDVIRLMLRIFLNHPFALFEQILFSKLILLGETTSFPLQVSLVGKNDLIWVAREAAGKGVLSQDLDLTLEYNLVRFPSKYCCMVWDVKEGLGEEPIIKSRRMKISTIDKSQMICRNDNYILAKFNDASVWHSVYVQHQSQSYFPEMNQPDNLTLWPHAALLESDENFILTPETNSVTILNCDVLFVGSSDNWFHFLVDIAPRIIFALENIIISMPILVKSTAPENIKKVLKILSGFDPIESHMYNEVSSSNIYVVQDVIPKTLHDYRFDSMRLGIVRSKLLLNLRSTHSKRIFLDRKRGLFRPMQNKSQIRRLLRSFGFIFIYPEDLDILDSVGLFYGAEIIIGESGAALSNIMFMNPSSVFIELYPGYGDVGFWRRYAQNFDINYFELSGTSRMIGLQGIAMDGFRISRKALKKLLLEILH